MRIKITILLLLSSFFLLFPTALFAQNNQEQNEEIFKARVVEIVEQKNTVRDDGSISIQQKIKLKGLERNWKDKEILFDGTEFDVLSASEYKIGDKVLVNYSVGPEGEENFYVIGFSRTSPIYWLAFLFALIVIAIGRLKGFRSLIVLLLTFLIILKFIIPNILTGSNPLLIAIIGSLFILILSVYITEGLKSTSTIAIFSILISTSLGKIIRSCSAKLTLN